MDPVCAPVIASSCHQLWILTESSSILFSEGEIQYNNDILAMLSPEHEKVSLGKVRKHHMLVDGYLYFEK